MIIRTILGAVALAGFSLPLLAAPGDPIFETCPESSDVGDNVECYPLTFLSKTEVHPDGIPIIAYLFVPTDRPDEPLPAIVFAHGSGSMYSSGGHEAGGGNHNAGLNSKHKQWVKQYTSELGYVSLHVDSFHSRYLLADTPGDQRVLDIDSPPDGIPGGDDYRATSTAGGLDNPGDDLSSIPRFDPNVGGWKDQSNDGAGVSEVMERAYDMDAAWDFLAAIRKGRMIDAGSRRNDDDDEPTLGTPMAEIGYIGDIIDGGITVDHQKIFLYGTSHGGQTAMATAHLPRILDPDNPMNAELAENGLPPQRFAAFFDYYGGCGLYGAYGGAGPDSTWRPYAAFIKFAGEYDSTVFDDLPVDSPEKFDAESCGKRFDAAYSDTEFDQFLEMVVYDDAFHSFDGVEQEKVDPADDIDKGNFNDWLAKIHANYRITVPFMDAMGRSINAKRAFEDAPTLDGLGVSGALPFFSYFTVPVEAYMPPRFVPDNPAHADGVVPVNDLGNFSLDLNKLIKDAFGGFFDLSCNGFNLPENVTIGAESCELHLELDEDQVSNLPMSLGISLATDMGTRYQPIIVEPGMDSDVQGRLRFAQPILTPPRGAELSTLHPGGLFLDLRGLAWSEYPPTGSHIINFVDSQSDAYTIIQDPEHPGETFILVGDFAPDETPDNTAVFAAVDGWAVSLDLDVAETSPGRAKVSIGDSLEGFNHDVDLFSTPATQGEDPITNFVALTAVSDKVPPPPGQFPVDGPGDENQAPVADAGEDQAVTVGDDVTLDGSGSTDAEDDTAALTFSWQQVGGTTVTLSDSGTAVATFTAPEVEESETLSFELTVTDTEGASDTNTVTITVNPLVDENTAPIADAGDDRTVEAGDNVTLDAVGSSDEDDDSEQLDFAWQQTGGTPVELSATDVAVVSFTAPAVDSVETLVFELAVTDSGGLSDTDSVTIIVNPAGDGSGDDGSGDDGSGDDGSGDDSSGDDGSGDDGSGDDGSGDDGSGDDGSGDDGSGDDGSGDDGSGDDSSGGGGALLWLMPVAILLRRRSRG